MKLETKYLTQNPYFNDGRWITGPAFRGFFLHSVGVGQPAPLVFLRQWNKPGFTYAGISGFIGADTVYLSPGSYTVTETKAPANTIIDAEAKR